MLLDELVAAIDNVKSRIELHQSSLRQSEALTRYSLIDPMLRALGWDTADPALVTPEYDVGGKRADYALLEGSQVVVFLEAKRLDENLSTHRSQVAAYASELGIKHPALTNGNKWEVYDNSKLVPIDQRRILDVSISESTSSRIALQLLLLWRPNLASGEPVSANEPMLGYALPATFPTQPAPLPATVSLSAVGWEPLATFAPKIGSQPPSAILFPDNQQKQVDRWRDVLTETVFWLYSTHALTVDKSPISVGPVRYLVSTTPVHSSGASFHSSKKVDGTPFFVETSFVAPQMMKNVRTLLLCCGVDSGSVRVECS